MFYEYSTQYNLNKDTVMIGSRKIMTKLDHMGGTITDKMLTNCSTKCIPCQKANKEDSS